MFPTTLRVFLSAIVLVVSGLGESFKDSKIVIKEGDGSSEKECMLIVDNDGIRIERKKAEPISFRWNQVKSVEYERSASPRWKTAIFVSPLALLSKGKKHWLNVQAEDGSYALLRLDKDDERMVRAAIQSKWGKEVKVLVDN